MLTVKLIDWRNRWSPALALSARALNSDEVGVERLEAAQDTTADCVTCRRTDGGSERGPRC